MEKTNKNKEAPKEAPKVQQSNTPPIPKEAPKEGYRWALQYPQARKGYIDALLEANIPQAEAEARANSKEAYKGQWKEVKVGADDETVNMALNGLSSLVLALNRKEKGKEALPIIEATIKALDLKVGYRYGPHIMKEGPNAGKVQYTPVWSKKEALPEGVKVGDPKPGAKAVLRWEPLKEALPLEAQVQEVLKNSKDE